MHRAVVPLALLALLSSCALKSPEPEDVDDFDVVLADLESSTPKAPSIKYRAAKQNRGRASREVPAATAILEVAPANPETSGETYTDYGVNGFALTADDPLSTFAVDVDTGAWTNSRRKLREGTLPPTAGVRVEEFVNYFPYEYAQPTPGTPFAVDLAGAPSPFNSRNHVVRVGIQGRKLTDEQRKPAHLTFLVDVSGSMNRTDKIGLVKYSLSMLVDELQDGDTVAIATYAGATRVVLEPTPVSKRRVIHKAIDDLGAGGSTAMASGIDLAYRMADQTYHDDSINRVIVASDGDANVGTTSHTAIAEQIRDYAGRGITLTTLGFGSGNYNDTMMEQLANLGDGIYYYVDSSAEARRVLVDRLNGTLEVIARDVKIQVEWDPEVVLAYRLLGYENRDIADRDFRNDRVDAGEIGAGHQVTALYELALADGWQEQELGTVRVRNKAPGPDTPAVERATPMSGAQLAGSFAEAEADLRVALVAATFAEVLRDSPHAAEVSLRELERLARTARRVEYREDEELIELIGIAARLRGEGRFSAR